MSAPSPSTGIDRFSALVLGLVVFVCITMIGGASYLKYRLDQAENAFTSATAATGEKTDVFDKLATHWGYGGFLGTAQKYIYTHDASEFAKMKDSIKAAQQALETIPPTLPTEKRQELFAIADLFETALQKLDAPANTDLLNELTNFDLAPLYAALPVIESFKAYSATKYRAEAQSETQFWAMMLTLVSWFSLILASGCAVWIYLVLRDKQSAPMRALAQSIQNMAQGDMRTAIWGIERQDMIGELARAIDIARYHFSHMPDISLMSEQGPVRLRFEGGSRSLFEAMMKSISTDSENIRAQSTALTNTAQKQKDALESMTEKINTVLRDIEGRGKQGDALLTKAVREMAGGVESLKNAHAHAADQLARLIPTIQDRAQGLAEITQITGKQLTQTLQSLAISEISLRANMEQSKVTLTKLSTTADDLGERLFGAINLLQASGKVLGETTENIKSNWNNLSPVEDWGQRLDEIRHQLEELRDKIDAQTDAQSGMVQALEQTSSDDSDQSANNNLAMLDETLDRINVQLAELQSKLDAQAQAQQDLTRALEQNASDEQTPPPALDTGPMLDHLAQIAGQLENVQAKLDLQTAEIHNAKSTPAPQIDLGPIEINIRQITDHIESLGTKIDAHKATQSDDIRAIEETAQRAIDTSRTSNENALASVFDRFKEVAEQLQTIQTKLDLHTEAQTNDPNAEILRKGIADLGKQISELAELNGRIAVFISALPGDSRQAIREELQELVETTNLNGIQDKVASIQSLIEKSPDLSRQLDEIGNLLASRISDQKIAIDGKQHETTTKLTSLELLVASTRNIAEATHEELLKPKPPTTYTMPPELQQQFMDQWFQMSAQIEASRNSLTASITEQLREMEERTAPSRQPMISTKSAADYALQIQIEKQTEILSELVNTLSLLDAHVQQVTRNMHVA